MKDKIRNTVNISKLIVALLLPILIFVTLYTPADVNAEIDTLPPVIHLSTLKVQLPEGKTEVTNGDKVKLSVKITDDRAVSAAKCYYYIPGTNETKEYNLIKKEDESDVYEAEIRINDNTVSGDWKISHIFARDGNDNYVSYNNSHTNVDPPLADLSAGDFKVYGTNPDTVPPVIHLSTLKVQLPEGKTEVTNGDKVKLSVKITDDRAIFAAKCYYYIPGTNETKEYNLIKKEDESDVYEAEIRINDNTVSGDWKISHIFARDGNDNYVSYNNSHTNVDPPLANLSAGDFKVYGTNPDTVPPVIDTSTLKLELPEGKLKVTEGDKMKLSVRITDDRAVFDAKCYYYIPGTNETKEYNLIKKEDESDVYETEIKINDNTVSGDWKISHIFARDGNDNYVSYNNTHTNVDPPLADLSAGDFKVVYKENIIDVADIAAQAFTGYGIKPGCVVRDITYYNKILKEGPDYSIEYRNNIRVGTADVTIMLKGNYSGEIKKNFNIVHADISKCKFMGVKDKIYTGRKQYQKVKVNYKGKSATFKISYPYNRTSIGKRYFKVEGIKNFKGSKTLTYKILPGRVYVKKLRGYRKRMILYWSKSIGGVKYQIAYKRNTKKNYNYINTDKAYKTIGKLKSRKYYNVKIRAFKKVGGRIYYGSWSKLISVKVK